MPDGNSHDPDWDLALSDFEAIVRKYDRWLRYIVLRHGRFLLGYAALDEIVDETWSRALEGLQAGRFRRSVVFRRWLRGLCLNVLKSKHFRPSGQSLTVPDGDGGHYTMEPPARGETPEETAMRDEELFALSECLATRSERQQRLYERIYVEGLNNVETARVLGCSEAHVRLNLRPRLHRQVALCMGRKGFRL